MILKFFNSQVIDCNDLTSSESDDSVPTSPVYDSYKSSEGYHDVPPLYTGTFMPSKPDLVFHDAPTASETVPNVFHVELSTTKPNKDISQTNRPSAPIIKYWVSDSEDESEGNPQQALEDKGVTGSGYSRHMTGNISFLSNFEEINGGYVAFGGNPKGSKITSKDTECVVLSFDCKLPDDNHVLLRVPRENNMYNVNLKNIVPSGDLNCLFAKATLDEPFGCLVTILNTLDPLGIQENLNAGNVEKETVSAQQYVLLPLWSTGSKDPRNSDVDVAFDVKGNEPEVHVSLRVKDLSDEFKEVSVNSTNMVNAASAPVTVVGPNSTNITNRFHAAGPSDNAVSSNLEIDGKSSFVDPSQYPDDLDMPALEDIVYSDDEEDVGAETDFSNLETSITISPIPTTRIHKDHHVTQIISDLTSAPHTRSMEKMNPREYIKHSKILVGLKLCKRRFFNSICKRTMTLKFMFLQVVVTSQRNMMNRLKEAKGKSLIDLSTGVRDLSDEFEEFFVNSTNRVNAISAPVTDARLNSTSNTNSFNAAGPSDNDVSLNFEIGEKSSFVDPSQ
nr:hypothetical protein [Tanacetum cinerariifolium]